MASSASLSDRLAAFKQNFSKMMQSGGQLVGRRTSGYDELSQGLMENEYRQDGQPAGSLRDRYQGPLPGLSEGPSDDAAVAAALASQGHVPSQARPSQRACVSWSVASASNGICGESVPAGARLPLHRAHHLRE